MAKSKDKKGKNKPAKTTTKKVKKSEAIEGMEPNIKKHESLDPDEVYQKPDPKKKAAKKEEPKAEAKAEVKAEAAATESTEEKAGIPDITAKLDEYVKKHETNSVSSATLADMGISAEMTNGQFAVHVSKKYTLKRTSPSIDTFTIVNSEE